LYDTNSQSFVGGSESDSLSYPDVTLITMYRPKFDSSSSPVHDALLGVDGKCVDCVTVRLIVELDASVADIVERLGREPYIDTANFD